MLKFILTFEMHTKNL